MHPERSTGAVSMHQVPHDLGMPDGARVADMDGAADCAISGTPPPQRSLTVAPAVAVMWAVSCTLASLPYSLAPLPRTPSPPVGADRQALLQVFRN